MLSLKDCLRIAMEKNHRRPASRFAVAVAEAQHRQALASYWPQVSVQGGITRLSDAPNFIFPASTMYIPAQAVCGDVGYGKTEVAIRAAFKAALGGKQVTVLVPTTVLAQQHFNTFRERMADYPSALSCSPVFRTRAASRRA